VVDSAANISIIARGKHYTPTFSTDTYSIGRKTVGVGRAALFTQPEKLDVQQNNRREQNVRMLTNCPAMDDRIMR